MTEVVDGPAQPLLERDAGLPAKLFISQANVRLTLPWVVRGQRHADDAAAALRDQRQDLLSQLQDGELAWVSKVDRADETRAVLHHPHHALDQVVHVLEAAGLAAVAVHREVLVA